MHAGKTKVLGDKNGSIEASKTFFFLYGSAALLITNGEGLNDWSRVRRGSWREAGRHTNGQESSVDRLVLEIKTGKLLPTYWTGWVVIERTLQALCAKSLKGTRVRIGQRTAR